MKRKILPFIVVGILIVGLIGFTTEKACALSFGDTLLIEWLFPDTGTIYDSWTVVVAPGVEVTMGSTNLDIIDVSGTTPEIEFDFGHADEFRLGTFNGFRFYDTLSSITDFSSVGIFSSNMIGFDASRISFDSDNIFVNFQGLTFDSNTLVQLDINSVPDASIILLLGSSLIGLVGFGRKKLN